MIVKVGTSDKYHYRKEWWANRVLHHQSQYIDEQRAVHHPDEFYALLQVHDFSNLRNGYVTWWKDVLGELIYPMNPEAMKTVLQHCEWQGVGLVDGKWRLAKHGGYVSIVPLVKEGET